MSDLKVMRKYFVTAKADTPLRQLLEAHLPSTCHVEIIITHGGVWKGKYRILDPNHTIRAQETVKVHTSSFQGNIYSLHRKQIIFEDLDLLVVYKPGNLNVHAVPSTYFYNLGYGVNQYLEKQGIRFQSTPVTRLDRPVEGLVIFPKNKNSARKLTDSLKNRKIKKWYMGALEHRHNPTYLRIRDKIANDGYKTFLDENGKTADSLFIKIDSGKFADIYSIFIFTGRRHQIRFHASQYLAPIIGDWFYGSSFKKEPDKIALVCRGYNIPYKGKNLKIRLPEHYLDQFYERLPHAGGI